MKSKATTVEQYLAELPADRREAVQALRKVILKNIDKRFEEGMQYGMIGYYVPHSIYPAGYHCDPRQPLPYACLASQKNYLSLHIMSLYANSVHEKWFRAAWAKSGKKLDMGMCCIRIKKVEDVPQDVIGEAFRRVSLDDYVDFYEKAMLSRAGSAKSISKTKKAAAKKKLPVTAKKTAKKVSKGSKAVKKKAKQK